MITQASSENTITWVCLSLRQKRQSVIESEFENEISQRKVKVSKWKDLSIIALVGSQMREQVGISSTLFDALSHNGITKAIAQGSTELNIW